MLLLQAQKDELRIQKRLLNEMFARVKQEYLEKRMREQQIQQMLGRSSHLALPSPTELASDALPLALLPAGQPAPAAQLASASGKSRPPDVWHANVTCACPVVLLIVLATKTCQCFMLNFAVCMCSACASLQQAIKIKVLVCVLDLFVHMLQVTQGKQEGLSCSHVPSYIKPGWMPCMPERASQGLPCQHPRRRLIQGCPQ